MVVAGTLSRYFGMRFLTSVVGSFIGGFLGWALFGKDLDEGALQPAGIIGSIIGAIIALLIYRAATRRGVGGCSRRTAGRVSPSACARSRWCPAQAPS